MEQVLPAASKLPSVVNFTSEIQKSGGVLTPRHLFGNIQDLMWLPAPPPHSPILCFCYTCAGHSLLPALWLHFVGCRLGARMRRRLCFQTAIFNFAEFILRSNFLIYSPSHFLTFFYPSQGPSWRLFDHVFRAVSMGLRVSPLKSQKPPGGRR